MSQSFFYHLSKFSKLQHVVYFVWFRPNFIFIVVCSVSSPVFMYMKKICKIILYWVRNSKVFWITVKFYIIFISRFPLHVLKLFPVLLSPIRLKYDFMFLGVNWYAILKLYSTLISHSHFIVNTLYISPYQCDDWIACLE